jgi:Leucine-rich repeat (LRR) protein
MDTFQSTPLIQYLDLESNLLRTLPALPDSLQHLNVADNRLEALPATVANLENLGELLIRYLQLKLRLYFIIPVSLNASRNEIDASSPFTLYTTQLDSLDLSRNRFNSIPTRLFERSVEVLKKLWMGGNRLEELGADVFANFTNLQTVGLLRIFIY